ncbi:hypothetical protein ACFC0M_16565 [Streptomyces sp. NPDC056149]|uniref:hypothetical protein n=1 Tax=Streptomyces sp. NPDC056149 TaxID=3345728 RepID=UPI0035D93D55
MAEGAGTEGPADDSERGLRARPDEPHAPRADYGGAVYGSLQAASVVAGTAAFGPFPRSGLALLLVVTGLVFWIAHVYARLVGELASYRHLTWARITHVAGHEWPIAQAALAPAIAVVISPLLGLDLPGTAWFALAVAVAEQIGWASTAAIRAGASHRLVVASALVNLALGLVIVVLKAELH